MFNPRKKLRKRAAEFGEMARKVLNYRGDLLGEKALGELRTVRSEATAFATDADVTADRLEERTTAWDAILRRHGGHVYPKTFWNDNIETFLVAAIVVLGIRAFFLQPFIIPTNSMYPTYSGMYHKIYDAEERPTLLLKPFRFALLGARNHEVAAAAEGAARIPLRLARDGEGRTSARAAFDVVDARKWLVVPTKKKRYPLFVGGRPSFFEVPADFNADAVLLDRFFPDADSWADVIERERTTGRLRIEREGRAWIEVPGERFRPGETVLNFDVLSGDALFVDRFTYHFFPPDRGDPIVFRTGGIEGPNGPLGDKYYIKRLAGKGGDVLAIDPPVLFVDGEPATGAAAFRKNSERIDGYRGYVSGWDRMRYLDPGTEYTVPPDEFFALGDNSRNSQDSRYWGAFEEKRVIGRALFIYYPFTKRWGPAE